MHQCQADLPVVLVGAHAGHVARKLVSGIGASLLCSAWHACNGNKLVVLPRWDLVKRVPKEMLDYLADRANASAVDDNTIRAQYVACQEWLRY